MHRPVALALTPAAICVVCGALLAAVESATRPAREDAADNRRIAAARAVCPRADGVLAETNGVFVLRERDGGRFLGAAIEGVSHHGYAGDVKLSVGFDADGKVVDIAVVEAHETPGLGARIATEKFRSGFRGRPYNGVWKVRKDGGEIDAVTSATISSRAAAEAVADAASRFEAVSKEEVAP